jgi:tRNA pseudouridine32 synthase/23S rRNA pseudouridine746 synthase
VKASPAGSPLRRAFENAHFVVVDKPPGWLSVPSRRGREDARPCAGVALEVETGARIWPVHRLDVEASGLLLFAKHGEAHAAANGWFARREVEKTYEAWTEHRPDAPLRLGAARVGDVLRPNELVPGERFAWECRIKRGKRRSFVDPDGKPALTAAAWLGPRPGDGAVFAWSLHPSTGRPHQLRLELFRHGFPILGDALYGAEAAFAPGAIALRATRLRFPPAAAELGLPAAIETEGLERAFGGAPAPFTGGR